MMAGVSHLTLLDDGERGYQQRLTAALFDAAIHRLEAALARVGLVPATDAELLPLRRRMRSLIVRLGVVKCNTMAFQELAPTDPGQARCLHARVLDLADFAENLALRLGSPGDDVGLLPEIESDLDDLGRLIDGCLKLSEEFADP